ncbi:Uncharacterized membrane protein [Mesorhizobium albiziae]|uniref:Uncharacterized membrane protein n=1 Tax=Neomesorhizobium albiziae TaxID=335020 RepID=A0A1I4AFI9_9HYPH|nr:TadG family pilus assembly protein [Mesorhizobium albiziae]GLS32837.1 hypothetical protein GCM10007937_45470 [Mesorhizobium albiziae]SFK55104.1 Uncharacterized membrane protein [Mesorhizobium albiziae]
MTDCARHPAWRRFTGLLGDRSGNFATLGALTAPIAITLAAFAIDEGSLYYERRQVQALADLAAITASANIANAEAAVITTLRDNGMTDITVVGSPMPAGVAIGNGGPRAVAVSLKTGRYDPDPEVPADERFQPGALPSNAVEVALQKTGTMYFGKLLMDPPTLGASATASAPAAAAFSIGSRLASLNGGMLNALLGGLLGTTVSLKVMDYEALIAADVEVLKFVDALATNLHLTAATYDEVLEAKATVGQIATALAAVDGVSDTAKLALQAIAAREPANAAEIPLTHLLDLGQAGRVAVGNHGAGFGAAASIMEILSASAAIAGNGKQVDLNLGAALPGVLNVTLNVAVGEPPQHSPFFSIGHAGDLVRTAQTRLKLTVDVGRPNDNLGGGVSLLSVRLPIYMELAYAEAKLTKVSCPTGRPESLKVQIAARPGVAELRIAEIDGTGFADFTRDLSFKPAKIAEVKIQLLLLSIPLLAVNGMARIDIGNLQPQTLEFDREDIDERAIKTVSTRDVTRSLTRSLLNELKLSANLLNLPLDLTPLLATVRPAVLDAITPVTSSVDSLLYTVLSALGIKIGEADVRVTAATCGRSVLVQ